MIIPLIVLVILGVLFFLSGRGLLNFAFFLLSFGTLAAVPPEFIGGTTILASSAAFMLVAARQFMVKDQPQKIIAGLIDYRALGPLTLFSVIAVVGAFTLPRAFGENVMVYPMRGAIEGSFAVPLAPSSSNFNQSLNLVADLMVAGAIFGMSRISGFTSKIKDALIWGGIGIVVTGFADLIGSNIGLTPVLELFRTASYVMMDEDQVNGVRRVIGMMSEASSFGALSVTIGGALLFSRYAYDRTKRFVVVYPLAVMCLLFVVISTSSSAYGALGVLGLLHLADLAWRAVFTSPDQRGEVMLEIAGAVVFGVLVLAIVIGWETGRDQAKAFLDQIIFNKQLSGSARERNSWTNQGLEAFKATFGIGVGVGSVRTSNFFVNILASTGVAGAIVFAATIVRTFAARIPSRYRSAFELAHGMKLTIVGTFVSLFFAGTTPDYGFNIATAIGICIGLATRSVASQSNFESKSPIASEDAAPEKARKKVERL